MVANDPMALPNISLKMLSVLATEPFVGLRGLDLGLDLRFTKIPQYYWPFQQWSTCAGQSLTQSSMGGFWNQVSAPRERES